MHEATITVEYVNEPDKNPDFGSVKADGKYWGVPKSMLSQFEKGRMYTVGYTTTEGKTGKTFYNIKELRNYAAPSVGHNNAPISRLSSKTNGIGVEKDVAIIAEVIFKGAWSSHAARSDVEIDRKSMGDFWFECLLAADWGLAKYKKFWVEKAAPKPPPTPPQEPPFNDDLTF